MSQEQFATEIAAALKRTVANRHVQAKTIALWTGTNERTVKNWLSGAYGPSGDHLMVLARHSDEVLNAILTMVGHEELLPVIELAHLEARILDLLGLVRKLKKP